MGGGVGAMKVPAEYRNTERERTRRCTAFKYFLAIERFGSQVLSTFSGMLESCHGKAPCPLHIEYP